MRIFVAIMIVLSVAYFWDREYNHGKLFDGLHSMAIYVSQYGTLAGAFRPPDLPIGQFPACGNRLAWLVRWPGTCM
jgi:hypothetical protein